MSVAVRDPVADGVNVTPVVHVFATVPVQVFDGSAKSPAFGPESVALVKTNCPVPFDVTVTVCAVDVLETITVPKLSDAGVTLRKTAAPVPVTLIVCGLPTALSAIEMLPVKAPGAVGLKVIATLQEAAATSVPTVRQSEPLEGVAKANCDAPANETTTEVTLVEPPFVTVEISCGE